MSNLFENIGRVFTDTKGLWQDITGASTSENIAKKNLEFQKENLEYQKELQKKIFEREDTAYQRTASDMMKAGLNPLSMNGTNGAGEAIMTNAPNLSDYSRDSSQALMEGIGHATNIVNSAFDNASKVGMIQGQKLQNARQSKTLDYMNKYGLNDMSPEWLKSATAIQNLVDSKKYLSMIDSAKKLGNDLPPDLKKLFIDLSDSTKNNLVETIKKQINANEQSKFSFPPTIKEKDFRSKPTNNAPKPHESFKDKVWNSLSDSDNLIKQQTKKHGIRKNNAKYWSNYANSYIK